MYNIFFSQILYLHEGNVLECAKIPILDELDFYFFLNVKPFERKQQLTYPTSSMIQPDQRSSHTHSPGKKNNTQKKHVYMATSENLSER